MLTRRKLPKSGAATGLALAPPRPSRPAARWRRWPDPPRGPLHRRSRQEPRSHDRRPDPRQCLEKLRRPEGDRRRQLFGAEGSGAGHHRHERRGEIHAIQPDHGQYPGRFRDRDLPQARCDAGAHGDPRPRGCRPQLPDPAAPRRPHRVRESPDCRRFRSGQARNRVSGRLYRDPARHRTSQTGEPAGRLALAARPQAVGSRPRHGHGAGTPAFR